MMNLRKKSIFNKKTKKMNLNQIMIMRLRFPKERQTQKKKQSKFFNKKTILNSNNEDKIWYKKLNEKNNQGLN